MESGKIEEVIDKEIQLSAYKQDILQFEQELMAQMLSDGESQRNYKMYLGLNYPEKEASRRVLRQFADSRNILLPHSGILPESCFTVAPVGEVQFEPVYYCLGVVINGQDLSFGGHFTAADDLSEDDITNIVSQVKRFAPKDPKNITFLSAHLGETLQHQKIISAITKVFPLLANMVRNSSL